VGILVRQLETREALDLLAGITRSRDEHAVLHAARTLQLLGEKARPILPAMREAIPQCGQYARWSLEAAVRNLTTGGETITP